MSLISEIQKEKDDLNKKYNILLTDNLKMSNLLNLISTHVKSLTFNKSDGILFFSKVGNVYYLNNHKENVCMVCGKANKTNAHHLIPIRAGCKNPILKELRIRVCKKCDKKVHPEHKSFAKKVFKKLLKDKDNWKRKYQSIKKQITIIEGNRKKEIKNG